MTKTASYLLGLIRPIALLVGKEMPTGTSREEKSGNWGLTIPSQAG